MKMVQAKLVDAEMLAECDKAAAGDEAALLDALGEGDGNGDGKDSKQLADALMMNAGKGGRGGGPPAAMTWSEGVEEKGAAFKEKVLPPAALSSLKKSRLAGISAGDPTAKKAGGGSSGGAWARPGRRRHARTPKSFCLNTRRPSNDTSAAKRNRTHRAAGPRRF